MFWIWIEIKSNKKREKGVLNAPLYFDSYSSRYLSETVLQMAWSVFSSSSRSSFRVVVNIIFLMIFRLFKPIMTRSNEPDEEEFHRSIIIILIWKDLYTGLDFISRQLSAAHCCGLFVIFLQEYWCINHRNLSSSGADQSVVLLPAASQRKKKSCARVKETSTDDVRPLLGELIFCGGFMTLSIIIEEEYDNHEITYPKPPTPTY